MFLIFNVQNREIIAQKSLSYPRILNRDLLHLLYVVPDGVFPPSPGKS